MPECLWLEPLEPRLLLSRAVGIDVSSYQGAPNWNSVYNSGVNFAYVKATEGTGYTDPYFSGDIAGGTAASVVMGAYHYARYDLNSAVGEANYFLSVAKADVMAGYMRPMLDVEQATSLSASALSIWVNTWCNTVLQATGVKPVVYTYISFAAGHLNSTVTQWPLWMANYNGQNPQTGAPNGTAPWSSWSVWQYTSTGGVAGISGNVDMDVAAGDMSGYVIPQLVAGSSQFAAGQTVHVVAAGGLNAWNTYASNGSSIVEPNGRNGVIQGGPVFIKGSERWPVKYAGDGTTRWSAGNYLAPGQVPVSLTSTTINDGSPQRSEVRSLTLKFNYPVSPAGGAVSLFLLNTGGSGSKNGSAATDASAALATPVTADGGLTWLLPIRAGTAFSDSTASLTDGIYTLTLNPANVTGGALGGTNLSITFHRLFGDIDGNGTVNSADYFQFKNTFGTASGSMLYNASFDFDNNGKINSSDYFKFKANFGRKFTY